jgi:hypothetical protein
MYLSLANTPFCLDILSSDFHDGVGTTANTLTGEYVLADGRKGNMYNGPYPQVTVGVAAAATTAGGAAGASETATSGAGTAGSTSTAGGGTSGRDV